MHPSLTSTLIGLAVWLLCLTAAILGKRYMEKKGQRSYSWAPVLAFVALSIVALLVAGSAYRSAHGHPVGGAIEGSRAGPTSGPDASARLQSAQSPPEPFSKAPPIPAPDSETSSSFDFGGM